MYITTAKSNHERIEELQDEVKQLKATVTEQAELIDKLQNPPKTTSAKNQ